MKGITMTSSFLRIALVSILLSLSNTQAKQLKPTDYELQVKTDRAEAVCHRGEKVAFTITLTKKGQPVNDGKIKWSISKDCALPPL